MRSPVCSSRMIRSPLEKLKNVESTPAEMQRTNVSKTNSQDIIPVRLWFGLRLGLTPFSLHIVLDSLLSLFIPGPGLGQSISPTTYLDLFLRPSRKATTRSRMSSELLEVNVYSSPLTVAKVKLWPWSFPPLEDRKEMSQSK